jgi:hypothetical protein
MPLPLLATAYLPPVEYVALIQQQGGAIIEVCETYRKQTYRNRCHIATPGGILPLIVPVLKPNGNHTITNETGISYHVPWHRTHWRSIESAYNSSPFFLYYRDAFEPLYNRHYSRLVEMNNAFMNTIAELLRIKVSISFTDSYLFTQKSQTDLRSELNPKNPPVLCELSDFPLYNQVFGQEHGFLPNLSIIDLLFNLGPDSHNYLERVAAAFQHKYQPEE